ncbi:MAG: hypothetical protein K9I85_04560 [Saprospiraceae bacterium]|nr:hypothetical protein [Saprospiraceae bacterium]
MVTTGVAMGNDSPPFCTNTQNDYLLRGVYTLISFFGWIMLTAQPTLLPHIGQAGLPAYSDPVCEIPVFSGSMDQSGFAAEESVPDFTLYTVDGDSVRLSEELAKGKPVLLVGANYTCPVWRGKINVVNEMADVYDGLVNILVIYTVEAHPAGDVSPYSGEVWTTSANEMEGILYGQPKIYGERLAIVSDMIKDLDIIPRVLVDGPCNPWWSNYGPAPNNAYLIRPDGTVAAKHGWFLRSPDNMWCDIDKLLGMDSGNCFENGDQGTFSLTLDEPDSVAYGKPGQTLAIHSTIQNLSSTDDGHLRIQKVKVTLPKTWETALCADICYASNVDETEIVIGPGETQPFIFYFYTGSDPESGYARVRFQNMTNNQNRTVRQFYGITTETSGTASVQNQEDITVFPNPGRDHVQMTIPDTWIGGEWRLVDPLSRVFRQGQMTGESQVITISGLPPGPYILYGIHPEGQLSESYTLVVE